MKNKNRQVLKNHHKKFEDIYNLRLKETPTFVGGMTACSENDA